MGSGKTTFNSPLSSQDIGVPKTPEQRMITPINEDAFDEGYASEGLRSPWKEGNIAEFDQGEAEVASLPLGLSQNIP